LSDAVTKALTLADFHKMDPKNKEESLLVTDIKFIMDEEIKKQTNHTFKGKKKKDLVLK